ncbi:hypothetical protein GCM10027567_00470 [Spongiibacter taiwanensis]
MGVSETKEALHNPVIPQALPEGGPLGRTGRRCIAETSDRRVSDHTKDNQP